MILGILVAYKAFNDKSLTIATNEHVFNDATVSSIDDMFVTVSSQCDSDDDIVSEYIKPADRDSNFKTIKYADINGIRITA